MHKLTWFVLGTTSLLITQEVLATQSRNNQTENSSPESNLISYRCPRELQGRYGYRVYTPLTNSQNFYQVRTQSGELRIRANPGGRVIGAVPSGWQVYVTRFDSTRRWAYIRSVFPQHPRHGFGNAPNFRSDGWVSVDHLVYLGEYCQKPNLLALLPDNLPVVLNEENLTDTVWHSVETEMLGKLNQN